MGLWSPGSNTKPMHPSGEQADVRWSTNFINNTQQESERRIGQSMNHFPDVCWVGHNSFTNSHLIINLTQFNSWITKDLSKRVKFMSCSCREKGKEKVIMRISLTVPKIHPHSHVESTCSRPCIPINITPWKQGNIYFTCHKKENSELIVTVSKHTLLIITLPTKLIEKHAKMIISPINKFIIILESWI